MFPIQANYEHISVNSCPNLVANYQHHGKMQINNNGGADPNYRPNSFNNIIADENNKEPPMELDSNIADWLNRNYNDNDH